MIWPNPIAKEDRRLVSALRSAVLRATGAIQPCPDCEGSGRDPKIFGYCLRCDGAGEIGKAIA
jgi:DnaJ-class molecular chaperone